MLAQTPAQFDALHMLGVVRYQQGDLAEATALMERAVRVDPGQPAAHLNLALAYIARGELHAALTSLDHALALDATFLPAINSRGNVLFAQQRHDEAIACFERVLAQRPDDVDVLSNRANALLELRRFDEAVVAFEALVERAPGYPYALGGLVHCQRQLADWTHLAARERAIVEAVRRGAPAVAPLALLAITDAPHDQLACARAFAARQYPDRPSASLPVPASGRIRVAYLSADLRDHAVGLLISGLIERHDRGRFEVIGVSWGPADESPARRRLVAAFDRFVDVADASDDAVAADLRALDVDVAVDLMGYTAHSRTGIFTRRAAPIQVNYLGYPGTMGTPCIDYVIADAFVAPAEADDAYSERIVRLPGSFQVNDAHRAEARDALTREDAGLPHGATILACFNAVYKIGPAMFDVWMRILTQVPGALLWMVVEHPRARDRLRDEAARRGVDPARLAFAARAPYARYLAQLRLADLFVDSLPFNAGTTASDALWMGVPVLTCAGRAFAARMAGSLLHACGLGDLVTHDVAAYEARAVELARDPAALRGVRARVARVRAETSLFDTDRSCRHIEDAYTQMVARARRGEPPAPIRVTERS